MRTIFLKLVALLALIAGLAVQQSLADAASQFAEANRAYAAGKYEEATKAYTALIDSGQRNAALFYDLGNTWFRRGYLGRAVLNYERALTLDPEQPEATANLAFVRDQARSLELPEGRLEQYLAHGTSAFYAGLACGGFWIGLFALAAFFFSGRRLKGALAVTILGFLVCAGAAGAEYLRETGTRGRDLAVVTTKSAEARVATADSTGSVLVLPAGSEVKILSTRGDWSYAELPNSKRGWIPTERVEFVRM
jgi:tetratricopeptide (TPR) repeat protein